MGKGRGLRKKGKKQRDAKGERMCVLGESRCMRAHREEGKGCRSGRAFPPLPELGNSMRVGGGSVTEEMKRGHGWGERARTENRIGRGGNSGREEEQEGHTNGARTVD
jgi:hypothetical protein